MCFGCFVFGKIFSNTKYGEAMPKYINMGVELGNLKVLFLMSSFRNVFLSVEDKSCFRCINILKKFTL